MNALTFIIAMLVTLLLVVIETVVMPLIAAAETVVMHAGRGAFTPQMTTIETGQRVTWVNGSRTDDIFVTASWPVTPQATAGQGDLEINAVLRPGSTYTHVFTYPGTYYYFCSGHMDMWGAVIVN
jgi:plastocyanin